MRLKGKRAIVTGAGGRIGAAIARRFVAEGARVVVADVREDVASAVVDGLGSSARVACFDVANTEGVAAMVAAAAKWLTGIDILVNAAAIVDARFLAADADAISTSFGHWDRTMEVNARGYFATCKYVLPHMIASGSGSVVNIASSSGLTGDSMCIAYGTSKGAVIAMTKYVATQHGRQNVRCNAIAPGLTLDTQSETHLSDFAHKAARHVLLPRLGRPEDVAALACFLASDDADFLTGQVIGCDGGVLAHHPHFADAVGDDS